MEPPHCREALGSERLRLLVQAPGLGWKMESTIKLSETKKVPQYCALQPMCRGSFVFLPRTFHPLRAKRQSGRQTYRLVRHEINWNILLKTHRDFAGRKPRRVSGGSPVVLRLYIIDGLHGVSTSTYMYAGQVRRIVACYCYNKGEPACSNVFRFICGIILEKLKDRWALLLNYSLLNYEVSELCTTYTHVLFKRSFIIDKYQTGQFTTSIIKLSWLPKSLTYNYIVITMDQK